MYAAVSTQNGFYNEFGDKIKGATYFICDSQDDSDPDIAKLPTNCGVGSRALCIYTGHIYIFGPSKKWVLYKGVSVLN